MDLNSVRSLFTVWIFVSFILVLYVVLSRRNKDNYDHVAHSIVDDPDTPEGGDAESSRNDGAK